MDSVYGVGEKIKKKIKEFLEVGTIKRVENLRKDPKNKIIEVFSEIWGVGPETAEKLYLLGYRTIEELRKDSAKILTKNA